MLDINLKCLGVKFFLNHEGHRLLNLGLLHGKLLGHMSTIIKFDV